MRCLLFLLALLFSAPAYGQLGSLRDNPYNHNSLRNPYGAGSRYKADGLNNPYSRYGSRYSNESWANPYATNPPKIYSGGRYRGELSVNPYRRDSVSNPYGRYGSRYNTRPLYVWPGR